MLTLIHINTTYQRQSSWCLLVISSYMIHHIKIHTQIILMEIKGVVLPIISDVIISGTKLYNNSTSVNQTPRHISTETLKKPRIEWNWKLH